ncbi:thiamine-phosphate kinase [Inmirania thermothiophila]|uniref:Thiamine-monophosphate kinase n=1 Tax=Inmirania thermothiophila TaxID=1750597 RepID=A0A3N1Y824_9GAMM|nr:thiamine-phosphate kinase [Inmirania thermothiophila]ROR34969.1 thiamine-monophosphate kinase [Inmirania thermothiophila]
MQGEFDLIERFFRRGPARADVALGVGDDAALLRPPPGCELVAATDTLVEGVHFPAGTDPAAVGHKALAVNLSDLAAMGAEPRWALLALTLPAADEDWLAAFAAGLEALAREAGVALVGGDTTRGPLAATVTVLGSVPAGQALRRCGARPGDDVWVSGTLGDAALGLAAATGRLELPAAVAAALRARLDRPRPRLALGRRLRGLARACIDVSDGLVADLGHVCRASGVGARIERAALPLSPAAQAALAAGGDPAAPLVGGDDYELLFTAPPWAAAAVAGLGEVARIGTVEAGAGVRIVEPDGSERRLEAGGWDHFRGRP